MYALDTTRYEVLRQLGGLAMQQGQDARALEYFRRYADRFPQDARSYRDLAQVYARMGEHERALQQYQRASLLDAEDVDALLGAGWVLADLGRFDEAERRFEEALTAAGTPNERADVYGTLQAFHDRRGQMSMAVRYMEQNWAAGASAAVPLVLLQVKLDGLGQYVRAGELRVAQDTLQAIARQLTGPLDALLAIGRFSIAVELENPDSLDALLPQIDTLMARFGVGALRSEREYAAGLAREFRGACAEALPHYERARVLAPARTSIAVAVARCQRTLGRLDAAEKLLDDFLRIHPYDPKPLYERALVYRDRGRRSEAVQDLRKAMEVWAPAEPVDRWARRARELLASLAAG
jgi:tetratricopeptide (TPR) repeat protein